jgi:N-acetylglucosamine-6-phosphate deacetylase
MQFVSSSQGLQSALVNFALPQWWKRHRSNGLKGAYLAEYIICIPVILDHGHLHYPVFSLLLCILGGLG